MVSSLSGPEPAKMNCKVGALAALTIESMELGLTLTTLCVIWDLDFIMYAENCNRRETLIIIVYYTNFAKFS